jgi:hypothetical protein
MIARSVKDLEAIWVRLEHAKKFSDGLISIGGVGIFGVNGLIGLVSSALALPGIPLFEAYTALTALYLFSQAISARASAGTYVKLLIYMGIDAGTDLIPEAGGLIDTVLRAPRLAAGAIQKEIEQTHWVEQSWREVRAANDMDRHYADMRAAGKKRVVFLRD